MNITLLHAHYENSEHDDTYAFTGKKAYEAALRQALSLIAEYVDGNWDEYAIDDVQKFRSRVNSGQYAEAVEQWNSMSTMQLTIEDTSSYTDGSVGLPCFKWPDDD